MSTATLMTLMAALAMALLALPALPVFYPAGIACVLAGLMLAMLAISGLDSGVLERAADELD
ncbi:hypothetical protein [Deinococcus sp.]|uniref:hypothetical protein n=1 Tax=Deinococcus sp. TaxID=47478 RepID=UPI003CC5BF41